MRLIRSNSILHLLVLYGLCAGLVDSVAQEIPLGTWRSHVSYNKINSITFSSNNTYAASTSGVQVMSHADNSIKTFTKVNGLSDAGITCVAFHAATNQLLISYENGNLDIMGSNGFTNYPQLKDLTNVTGSKRINDIAFHNTLAYIATDFGVVVFDLALLEIKETFRDLGATGERLRVYESTFYNDSIFIATEKGVIAGDLGDNLLDFNNWKRFDTGDFDRDVYTIEYYNNKLYAGLDGVGVYSYASGTWTLEAFLQGESFIGLQGSTSLFMTTESASLWELDDQGSINELIDPLIREPIVAAGFNGKRWMGDGRNGLIVESGGSYNRVIANAPTFNVASRLRFNSDLNQLLAVSGGPNISFVPSGNVAKLNGFMNGNWSTFDNYLENDLTDVVTVGANIYLSSFGFGVQVINDVPITTYNELNSPLQNIGGGNNVWVSALARGSDGIWVVNYGATQSLHYLETSGNWTSFNVPNLASRYATNIETDYLGNAWLTLDPGNGGGILVVNKGSGESIYLTDVLNQGGLPSRNVYSIKSDRSGQMWIGTDQGVAYFPDPARVLTGAVNAIRPIFEGRFLLRDERITALAIDGGNRKWIGTDRGVWLLEDAGDSQLFHFNEDNSPLLSDKIIDIAIHSNTGEVFFSTEKGMCSFRSDATSGKANSQTVKIFPNPVTASFNGLVGIAGLANDAIVKITDVSGKLIWQTTANGGTASWNVRDDNGRRASTGIYLIFSTSTDGTESVVGKLAVVN